MRSRPDRGEGLAGCEIAGRGHHAGGDGRFDHRRVCVRRDDQPSANRFHLRYIDRIENRAGSDECLASQRVGDDPDAFERVRRVERDLDDPDPAFVDRPRRRLRVVRGHAANDRNQRALGEVVAEIVNCAHRLAPRFSKRPRGKPVPRRPGAAFCPRGKVPPRKAV